jgi:hypothetical protein
VLVGDTGSPEMARRLAHTLRQNGREILATASAQAGETWLRALQAAAKGTVARVDTAPGQLMLIELLHAATASEPPARER